MVLIASLILHFQVQGKMIGRIGGKKSINYSVITPGRLQNFSKSSKINEKNIVDGDPLCRRGPVMTISTLTKRVQNVPLYIQAQNVTKNLEINKQHSILQIHKKFKKYKVMKRQILIVI